MIDDVSLVRPAILRTLGDRPRDTRFLLRALRRLGLSGDDEAFRAARGAGDPAGRSLYDDTWRNEMIRTFGARPEIRELARAELLIRDGEIGAVAETFAADAEMCGRILKVLARSGCNTPSVDSRAKCSGFLEFGGLCGADERAARHGRGHRWRGGDGLD